MKYILFLIVGIFNAYALNLCTVEKNDLCVGISGLEPGKTVSGLPLQLKSRYNSIVYDSSQKMQFVQNENETLVFTFENQTVFMDKAQKGSSLAILSKKIEGPVGAVFTGGTIQIFNGTRCLTVMKCPSAPGDKFCSPGEDKIERGGDFKKGAYLNFLPCETSLNNTDLKQAQAWAEDPPCHVGCTDDMLLDEVCDQECNYLECFYDFGSCNGTYSPTSSPSTPKPTKQTKQPTFRTTTANPSSYSPTGSPEKHQSLLPTSSPTHSPSVPTSQPSFPTSLPTQSPSLTPSLSPSQAPSLSPSQPSAVPTSLAPSSQLSLSPTASPLILVEPTLVPTLQGGVTQVPTLPNNPETVPTSNPSTAAEPAPYFDLGWIALIVILFIIIFGIGGFFCVKFYYKELNKRTVGNARPAYPDPLPSPPGSPRRNTTPDVHATV